MAKTFKENMQSQIGNLAEVKLKNGILKIGLLLSAELPDRKMTWRDASFGEFKWGWSAYNCLWNTAPSKQKKMLALSIFSDGFAEVFMVLKDDIKVVT
jgi:hypothetical protein